MKKGTCILLVYAILMTILVIAPFTVSANDNRSLYGLTAESNTQLSATGAITYTPSDRVSLDIPTCEEAILACGGSLRNVQYNYFQAPEDWANEFNTFADYDGGEPYMHICAYWFIGDGTQWPDGKGVQWFGYRATLVDNENRIYRAAIPNNTNMVIWNNGLNGGMSSSNKYFDYARQIMDVNVEGADPGDYSTLPEGTPNPDSADGCISIIDYSVYQTNPLLGLIYYGSNWYIYYGDGCYGMYNKNSSDFVSVDENCCNPEHFDSNGNHVGYIAPTEAPTTAPTPKPLLGDVDVDGEVTVTDATLIQRFRAGYETGYPIGEPIE